MAGDAGREAALARATELVAQRAGLELGTGQRRRLAALVEETATARGLGVEAWVQTLAGGVRAPLDALIDALVVHETGFFRHAAQVAALRERVLPELLREAAQRRAPLRLWSAGCATGEEAWTLALLLAEAGVYSTGGAGAEVLATDISAPALERAAAGRYHGEELEEVPEKLRARYFVRDGERWTVAPWLRERVRFERLNLAADPYPGAIDLVLCRNVLIYFAPEARERAVGELHRSLRAGGWLVLGYSESLRARVDLFEAVDAGETTLWRRARGRSEVRPRAATLASADAVRSPTPLPVALARGPQRLVVAPGPPRPPADPLAPMPPSPAPSSSGLPASSASSSVLSPSPSPFAVAAAAAVAAAQPAPSSDDTQPGLVASPLGPRRVSCPTGDAAALRRAIARAIGEGAGRVEVDLDAASYLTAEDGAALTAAARLAVEQDAVLRLRAERTATRAFVARIGLLDLVDPPDPGPGGGAGPATGRG
ncbi:MAG TPA: protein-glutamate O-methyltransferase CheR [Myxococcota bacterium]|jgi:chemotaxis protein methyltransferase CheR|nr:protein-glutamate O-methyltransferase CheR [Myxococcota bacterium]